MLGRCIDDACVCDDGAAGADCSLTWAGEQPALWAAFHWGFTCAFALLAFAVLARFVVMALHSRATRGAVSHPRMRCAGCDERLATLAACAASSLCSCPWVYAAGSESALNAFFVPALFFLAAAFLLFVRVFMRVQARFDARTRAWLPLLDAFIAVALVALVLFGALQAVPVWYATMAAAFTWFTAALIGFLGVALSLFAVTVLRSLVCSLPPPRFFVLVSHAATKRMTVCVQLANTSPTGVLSAAQANGWRLLRFVRASQLLMALALLVQAYGVVVDPAHHQVVGRLVYRALYFALLFGALALMTRALGANASVQPINVVLPAPGAPV
jgi:hypothetical protein